ncbi:MAG: translation initiation factor IF-2 N-terminal domain-containing protein, partial [Arcobacter sp.]
MSDNVRVYEIAEEAGASSNHVINKAKDLGIELKSPQSQTTVEDAEEIVNYIMTGKSKKLPQKKKVAKKVEEPKIVEEETVVSEETKPKEEVTVKETKLEEPKEEIKPVIEKPKKTEDTSPKKTDDTQEVTDTLSVKKVIPKRRGLKIVKKKKPEEPKVEKKEEPSFSSADSSQIKKPMKSLSEILGGNNNQENQSEAAKAKAKVQKKKAPPRAHEHGKVLEI